MLDSPQPHLGHLGHLPGHRAGHRRQQQVRPAALAALRPVGHDLVRVGDHGQVGAWGARLLAGPPRHRFARPRRMRRLAQPVRRRRLGRGRRGRSQLPFELGDPGLQRLVGGLELEHDQLDRFQLGDPLGLRGDQRGELVIGGPERPAAVGHGLLLGSGSSRQIQQLRTAGQTNPNPEPDSYLQATRIAQFTECAPEPRDDPARHCVTAPLQPSLDHVEQALGDGLGPGVVQPA
jgi:hypothetical protein